MRKIIRRGLYGLLFIFIIFSILLIDIFYKVGSVEVTEGNHGAFHIGMTKYEVYKTLGLKYPKYQMRNDFGRATLNAIYHDKKGGEDISISSFESVFEYYDVWRMIDASLGKAAMNGTAMVRFKKGKLYEISYPSTPNMDYYFSGLVKGMSQQQAYMHLKELTQKNAAPYFYIMTSLSLRRMPDTSKLKDFEYIERDPRWKFRKVRIAKVKQYIFFFDDQDRLDKIKYQKQPFMK